MAENSKIEWTHHTFNPWIGCTKVAPGCTNCYAETLMDTRYRKVQWGPNGTRVATSAANWRKPLQWDRAAAKAGERHRVFCASLADVFEDWKGRIVDRHGDQLAVDAARRYRAFGSTEHSFESEFIRDHGRWATMDDLRADLFRLIDATPNLDWLILSKRPENVRRMWPWGWGTAETADQGREYRQSHGLPYQTGAIEILEEPERQCHRKNVWLGTSVSDQETANVAVPRLLANRDLVPVLFLSAEPLVGPIDLDPPLCEYHGAEFIQWDDKFGGYICTECADGDSTGEACFGMWLGDLDERIDWVIVGGESGHGRRHMGLDWARRIRDQCKEEDVAFFMKQIDKVQPIPDDLMVREFPTTVPV